MENRYCIVKVVSLKILHYSPYYLLLLIKYLFVNTQIILLFQPIRKKLERECENFPFHRAVLLHIYILVGLHINIYHYTSKHWIQFHFYDDIKIKYFHKPWTCHQNRFKYTEHLEGIYFPASRRKQYKHSPQRIMKVTDEWSVEVWLYCFLPNWLFGMCRCIKPA